MLGSVVRPVPILSAVFCVICSVSMCVFDASGDHMSEMYSSMGLVMALYVARITSFCFPHVVDIYMCLLYVSLGSSVSPISFWLMFMDSVMVSICSAGCVLYSAGSGVKRVYVVLSGLRMRLFVRGHVCISWDYWMFYFAMLMSLCVDVMVMSSAYVVSFTGEWCVDVMVMSSAYVVSFTGAWCVDVMVMSAYVVSFTGEWCVDVMVMSSAYVVSLTGAWCVVCADTSDSGLFICDKGHTSK